MIPSGTHRPRRPEWTCRRCGDPYPCQVERDRLVAVCGLGRELGELASNLLYEAVRELPDVSVAELYDRFVRWTEPVRTRGVPPPVSGTVRASGPGRRATG